MYQPFQKQFYLIFFRNRKNSTEDIIDFTIFQEENVLKSQRYMFIQTTKQVHVQDVYSIMLYNNDVEENVGCRVDNVMINIRKSFTCKIGKEL
jgi:hypothetical protein